MSGKSSNTALSHADLAEYSGGTLLAVCGVLIALETTAVILRFFARRLTQSRFGWDDGLILFAWFVNMGLCAAGIGMYYMYSCNRRTRLICFFE